MSQSDTEAMYLAVDAPDEWIKGELWRAMPHDAILRDAILETYLGAMPPPERAEWSRGYREPEPPRAVPGLDTAEE